MPEVTIIVELNMWLAKELYSLERLGYISKNKFITSSVSKFISSPDFKENNLIPLSTDIIPMKVQIPNTQAWELGFATQILKINRSDVINTALGHSIPVLLEEIEYMETSKGE